LAVLILLSVIKSYKILLEVVQGMNILPRAEKAVIPIEKFTLYALNAERESNKAAAFNLALGYNIANADKLIENIRRNIFLYPAVEKSNKGYGKVYEVKMRLTGENGKTAAVITGWIDDIETGEMRLTSAYVDK
jgi:hypothetical protein